MRGRSGQASHLKTERLSPALLHGKCSVAYFNIKLELFSVPRKLNCGGKNLLKVATIIQNLREGRLLFSSLYFYYSKSWIAYELIIVYKLVADTAVSTIRAAATLQMSPFAGVSAKTSPHPWYYSCPGRWNWNKKVVYNICKTNVCLLLQAVVPLRVLSIYTFPKSYHTAHWHFSISRSLCTESVSEAAKVGTRFRQPLGRELFHEFCTYRSCW